MCLTSSFELQEDDEEVKEFEAEDEDEDEELGYFSTVHTTQAPSHPMGLGLHLSSSNHR